MNDRRGKQKRQTYRGNSRRYDVTLSAESKAKFQSIMDRDGVTPAEAVRGLMLKAELGAGNHTRHMVREKLLTARRELARPLPAAIVAADKLIEEALCLLG